ncbi:MAG: cyclic nucleotide-binding domain-containing protein [Deltaproteobacteria bacterium]|nr:cyclic nucleotide-binding domain-containing protein [Deltaproteobacteria bacterium]
MTEDIVYIDPRRPENKPEKRLIPGEKFQDGGMSVLLDAIDTNLMRRIAMKIVRDEKLKDEFELSRMVVEAQITAQLDHPNIIPVYELGLDRKDRLFFTMKKIRGKALYELINEKELSERTDRDLFRMVQIMIKVCDAVSYAHSKGVIHRDIKPDNIMVGSFGQVYLMDWGIARIKGEKMSGIAKMDLPEIKKRRQFSMRTEIQGNIFGTPCYMSPEQAHGDLDSVDERSDGFSIGATLYEILTGLRPIPGDSIRDMVINARICDIQPPDERVDFLLPLGLIRITMKAMKKEPSDRYQSAEELKNDLENFLEGSERFPGHTYRPGTLIVREGDIGHEAYVIRSGKCRAFKTVNGKNIELRIMGQGDVFGETAILTEKPRSASVEAIDTVTVAVIKSHYFKEELNTGSWLGPFIRALAERFREADQRLNP